MFIVCSDNHGNLHLRAFLKIAASMKMAYAGEILEDATKRYEIDLIKLSDYEKLFGYNYMVFTSELELSNSELLGRYHQLSKIEDCFRVTKSDLEGRPVFVRTREHINSHFLICFCAFQMIRLTQDKIFLQYQGKDTSDFDNWEAGLSADRLKKALNQWVCCVSRKGKISLVEDSEDLSLIKAAFSIDFGFKHVNEMSIRKFKHVMHKMF
jgi:hypothetical protein